MRISDWSSDVCSSDLAEEAERDARIQRIEEALLRLSGETTAQVEATGATATTPSPSPAVVDAQAVTAQATASDAASRLKVSGDFRLRAQGDWSDNDARNRTSMQVRGRLGATWAASDRLTVGARLAPGLPETPNTSDRQPSDCPANHEASPH